MAEEVEISNVGNGGTVASEETLAKLVAAVEKLAMAQGKGSGQGAKVQEMYNQAVVKGTRANNNNTKSTKSNSEAVKENTEQFSKMKLAMGGLLTGIGQLAGSAVGFADELFRGGDQISDFAKHLPLVGGYLSSLTGFIDNTVSTFRDLSATGAGFSGGINQMLQTAVDLELNLSEMAGMVASNSSSLRLLSGTVEGGVARFAAINKNMKASGDFASLKNLGFTVEEVNEGIADYGALQARLGRLQGQSNAQLAEGATGYLTQLDRLAKVTGKSRKELESEMMQRASNAEFRAIADQLSGDALMNFNESMALIDTLPADVATGLKDLADGIPQTVEGQQLLAAAGPEVRDAMMAVADGADPQVLIDALGKAGGELEGFGDLTGDERAAFIAQLRQTNPTLASLLDSATQMTELSSAELADARAEQERKKAEEDSLLTFDDKIKSIRAKIGQALLDSGVFDSLATAFTGMADVFNTPAFKETIATGANLLASAIKTMLDEFQGFIGVWQAEGFGAAVGNLFREDGPLGGALSGLGDVIGDAFMSVITNPAVIAGLAAVFAAPALIKGVAGAASRGIESKLANIFGGVGGNPAAGGNTTKPSGRTGAAVGKNAASAGAGIGKGLGNLGGGVLKGIAGGLTAFANPQVAIGAAVVAGVILVIGGAIAGASWLLGKALPTLVEGIKSFETIDGAALSSAASGMLALSGAMAAFGAGTAVAGLGSMVGGITGAIGKLFGADDPLEQLKTFAAANIDKDKVKNNAEALVAFSTAMAIQGAGAGASGVGNAIGAVGDAIASFFGADTPLEQVKEFGEMKLNTAQITANADAMKAMAGGLAGFTEVDLDKTPIMDYTTAIKALCDELDRLNTVLAEDNKDMLGRGTGVAAADALSQINVSTRGSAEGTSQLNSTMQAMLQTLGELKDINTKVEKNTSAITSGNIAAGYVSRT